jgi:hypothetical protein
VGWPGVRRHVGCIHFVHVGSAASRRCERGQRGELLGRHSDGSATLDRPSASGPCVDPPPCSTASALCGVEALLSLEIGADLVEHIELGVIEAGRLESGTIVDDEFLRLGRFQLSNARRPGLGHAGDLFEDLIEDGAGIALRS